MIPAEVLASDPVVRSLAEELSERRICRLCLSEVDSLVDIDVVWKMKIVSCFPLATIGSDKLPKLICEACGRFVKKCYEFRQLLKKSEQMLVSYPLTGSWSGELAIPRWLREEDRSEQAHAGKKRKFYDEIPQIGSVRVRSHESMSLQSPTITPGSMELTQPILDEDQPMREMINTSMFPTAIQQSTQPINQATRMTPTTYQSNITVPIVHSSQRTSSQYPSSIQPYNVPSIQTQFRNPTISITPVNQPQMITVQNVPQLTLNQGYLMQQPTHHLISRPQIQTYNTNFANMTQILTQRPAVQPQQQQQQQSVQLSFTNVNLNRVTGIVTQLQRTQGYQQTQTPPTTQNYQQHQIAMTPTIYQPQPQQQQLANTQTRIQPQQQHQLANTQTSNQPQQQQQLANTQTSNQPQQQQQPQKPANVWCHVCQYRFLTVDHYKYHSRKHNPNGIAILSGRSLPSRQRRCWLCTHEIFPTQDQLVRHLRVHETVGLASACDFCPKVFADDPHRNAHYQKEHKAEVRETLRLNGLAD